MQLFQSSQVARKKSASHWKQMCIGLNLSANIIERKRTKKYIGGLNQRLLVMLTIPQKPGLEIPTPPGQLSQCTSILNATLLRSKQELSSVCTKMDASVPTMAQGAIFDGT